MAMNQQPLARERAAPPAANRDDGRVLRPAVDVFEDAQGITVRAEMPGVSRDRLTVHADRNHLAIEGEMNVEVPEGMDALHAEVASMRYARSFQLSGELDPERIEANLRDGVLTVRIPKRAELQPRRVAVQVE